MAILNDNITVQPVRNEKASSGLSGINSWSEPSTAIAIFVSIGLFVWLARPVLSDWLSEYGKAGSYYSHAPFIPVIIGLMVWHRRRVLSAIPIAPFMPAFYLFMLSSAGIVYAYRAEEGAVMTAAFIVAIWSLVLAFVGPRFVKALAVPLLFLLMMAPLPDPILNDATLGMQMLSTVLANKLLHLLSFQTTLTGNLISMDAFQFEVDTPCSGLKLVLSMMAYGAAFAYLLNGPVARRIVILALILPLCLAVNALRIALVGVVGECIGSSTAHVFHDWSGIITLILGFAALFGLARIMKCTTLAGWPIS